MTRNLIGSNILNVVINFILFVPSKVVVCCVLCDVLNQSSNLKIHCLTVMIVNMFLLYLKTIIYEILFY